MLELPGLTVSGNANQDIQKILRYLSKLVPQIDMELMNANQDDYSNAYNALSQEIGNVDKSTTAGALAAHELRKDNPHDVTLNQLGFSMDRYVKTEYTANRLTVWIGEKRGLQINVQDAEITISEWEQSGGVCWAEAAIGQWQREIPLMFWAGVTVRGGQADNDYWAGPISGSTSTNIGTVRMYHECGINILNDEVVEGTVTETREIRLTAIGVGVFGYGE